MNLCLAVCVREPSLSSQPSTSCRCCRGSRRSPLPPPFAALRVVARLVSHCLQLPFSSRHALHPLPSLLVQSRGAWGHVEGHRLVWHVALLCMHAAGLLATGRLAARAGGAGRHARAQVAAGLKTPSSPISRPQDRLWISAACRSVMRASRRTTVQSFNPVRCVSVTTTTPSSAIFPAHLPAARSNMKNLDLDSRNGESQMYQRCTSVQSVG
jgi:hypothetical protein